MPQNCLLLLILLAASVISFAQPSSVANNKTFALKGKIVDTSANTFLSNASVSILRAKDSVLLQFRRTDAKGAFIFKQAPAGDYILLVTYPNYADYADIVSVEADNDIGSISMITRAVALQNVIVRGSATIRMKGDTTFFAADSFKVKEGASVEDLLRKIPGFFVNKKGEISANGEKVTKVLVDGDEFFQDDPTLATKNLDARMVKEVQVFDKKSDQANFTGVDDGERTKTINLKLKDEAKKGYFGNLRLAGGIPEKWDNYGTINFFKGDRKFSVNGSMSNIGQNGGDRNGIPSSRQIAANYSTKLNNHKNPLYSSYNYNEQTVDAENSTNTQYILPDTLYFNNQRGRNISSGHSQSLNGGYDMKVDSSQTFKLRLSGSLRSNNTTNTNYNEALAANGLPVNKNNTINQNNSDNGSANVSLEWDKKLRKTGRSVSVNVRGNYNNGKSDGTLFSETNYYTAGQLFKRDTIDQKKLNNNEAVSAGGNFVYTEPIGKKILLQVNYGYTFNSNQSSISSFDRGADGYKLLNELYSSDYKFNTQTNTLGASVSYNDKSYNVTIGNSIAGNNWNQYNKLADTTRKHNFINLFPRLNASWRISPSKYLVLNYWGGTQAPSLDQLQPILDNSNPLNIAIGNPDLKQSFSNSLRLRYNTHQVLKGQSMTLLFFVNNSYNAFGTLDRIDSLGRKTYQTVNVNGNFDIGIWGSFDFKWKKPDLTFKFWAQPYFIRNNNFVNGVANKNYNDSYSGYAGVSKFVDGKYNFEIGNELAYSINKTSMRPDIVTQYWNGNASASVGVYLPFLLEFNTNINYQWRQKISANDLNGNRVLWNASLDRKLFKSKQIRLGIRVNDILNQNVGFSRYISNSYITQNNFQVLRRYWMATFTWHFTKKAVAEKVQ